MTPPKIRQCDAAPWRKTLRSLPPNDSLLFFFRADDADGGGGEGQLLMGSSPPLIRVLLSAYGCTVLLLDSRGFRVGTLRVGDEEERTVIGYVDFWKNSSGHKN